MSLQEDFQAAQVDLKKGLKLAAGYSFVGSLCLLAMPLFLFQVYSRVIASHSMETLIALAFIVIVVLIGYAIFDAARQYYLARAAVKFEGQLAGLVLAGEMARQMDTNRQTINDLSTVRSTIASSGFGSLFDLPMMPILLILIFFIHPVLGVVVLLGGAALIAVSAFGLIRTTPLNKQLTEEMQAASRALDDQLNSQELVRAQGLYRESVRRWGGRYGKILNSYLDTVVTNQVFASATKAGRQILQILIIGSGAALVLSNEASAGIIFATSIIGGKALAPVEALIAQWRQLKGGHESWKRLQARLEELSLPENRTPLPRPKGRITLDRVIYSPRPGMPPIIKSASVQIAGGDTVAMIGPSGAGKSTLARLIVGYLEPTLGRIALDGQELGVWDPVARGLHVGYMPQQVNFFEATIRENIARLRLDDDPTLAVSTAQSLGIHDMIMQFPMGYDTSIARGVFWPSGGQAQLIALARAFYGNPSVLVLDEPNAALDQMGERILHHAIKSAKRRGMTVIVVTQRPSLVQHVDKVIMMQGGEIKDFGPKDEVLARNGVKQAQRISVSAANEAEGQA
ncbi:type I secretion system permease/ATPase [Gimibacter soli]|uniref:Type I secretion system permease/ATPase n=1 Tax=Gimibacter soli TaxID=3024400 RepID=A0AAE9XRP4_9PROT|nr:type I secretion system permease/ATPase [Gimibacter soli]WCL55121.1 type I secretion system permease/ATPase [Gimibacter soli]